MSKLPFEFLLALRYLRPRRTFVSVITVISIIGVMLGVAVLIIVISVMSGFDKQLRDRILGFNAHLRVVPLVEQPLGNYRELMKEIESIPEVKAVGPYVAGRVLLVTHPNEAASRVEAPYVRGLDPLLEPRVSKLPTSIVEGEFNVKGKGILVGVALADLLGIHAGDRVAIYSVRDFEEWQKSRQNGQEEVKMPEYVVNGIFDVGYYEYNYQFIACSLGNAQDMYALEDDVHGLIVMLHDANQASAVRRELLRRLDGKFQVRTWYEENSPILGALVVEKNMMFYLLFFIVLVAAFGITSAQITFVVQKTREIGALKALGATGTQIMSIFLAQSLVVGLLGVVCGYGLGMLAVTYRNEFLRLMRQTISGDLFPAEIYGFNDLPALIVPGDIAIICGGSLVICLLADLLPAWNAGRLKPVEALRHE